MKTQSAKDSLLKAYISFFKIPFICLVLLLIAAFGCKLLLGSNAVEYVRTNTECTTTERVFDYADKMTDAQEEALRQQIREAELFTGCDIIVVTLDESLEEYAKSYEHIVGPLQPYQYTMVYADNFYDEHKFGFDQPVGDGVLLLDNWYRESDGKIHSWMCTTGKVYEHYSSQMIDDTLNLALEYVDDDPAGAYSKFVELIEAEMGPYNPNIRLLSVPVSLVAGLAAALIFFFVNRGSRKGKKTVTAVAYVESGRPDIRVREDQFITKTVTRRKIETNSGGGGRGGGHVSAGGHSHGGGGRSR